MIGHVLGHYRVLENVGSGGMGEVYRATDDRLGRDVAIKILKSSGAQDRDRLLRFEQEARSAAALNHPNIVAVYDVGIQDGSPYIVSEFLEGETLRQRLLAGPLSPRHAADYARQIAQGLVAAHEKHIIHRDLKPENLFITRDGRGKILDFGIAKLIDPEVDDERSPATMTTKTRTGSILGTVAYMSPEQLRGERIDNRSDIFSFGAILYEMLTGRRAFSGKTQVDTMTAVLKEDPAEMDSIRQDIPRAFEQIVRHCLDKEPGNRFQSARDLAFALDTLSDLATTKRIRGLVPARRHYRRWLLGLGVAASLAVMGVILGTAFRTTPSPIYHRLTFERGTVYSARFLPDGQTVIYAASWNGRPLQMYSTMPDSSLARPLDLTSAVLLAVSRNRELAVDVGGTPGSHLEFTDGTLATAPMVGGTPREILKDVRWADWSPQGELAVVHHVNGHDNLEYPIGKVLYSTNGSISNVRLSPRGDHIAFMDHPVRWDDGGSVCVMDLSGKKVTLSSWQGEFGLAWSPDGNELWFAATDNGSTDRSLWAVNLSGHQRKLLTIPGGVSVEDIASDGRVLVSLDSERLAMEWAGKDDKQKEDLSWYDWSIAKDISPDGHWVLFEESSEPTGPEAIAIRNVDGSLPIHLGDGPVDSLSPDGKWAISASRGKSATLTLLPVGPGQPRQINLPGLENLQMGSHFLPDGKHIVVNGNEPGRLPRTFLADLSGGKPRPVTPEGVYATIPSPNGRYLAGDDVQHRLTLFPLDGGGPRLVPNSDPAYTLARWSADGSALYVYRLGDMPQRILRLDVNTGKTQLVRELVPADRGGVVSIAPIITNSDASEFAYSYYQVLSVLYVVSGLN